MTTHPVNITVERVEDMDDREMYNVSDSYVKGRLSRFAVDPDDQAVLRVRELPKSERGGVSLSESAEVFDAIKRQVYEILYSPTILGRHRFALLQMERSVQKQLDEYTDDTSAHWRRSAQSFMDMVRDELGRAEVILEMQQESSARKHLSKLLQAIHDHEAAEEDDVEEADKRLYAIAEEIAESVDGIDRPLAASA